MQQLGVPCDICDNGKFAIERVHKRIALDPIDLTKMYKLIIMDFSMQVCDGPTATKMIRDAITCSLR